MKFPVCLLMASMLAFGQQGPVQPPASPPVPATPQGDVLDHWKLATVALGQDVTIAGKRQFVTTGSAVIVSIDAQRACLLTAKHMFFNPNEGYIPTQISMRPPKDPNEPGEDFGVVIPLVVSGQTLWKTTAVESDLAVVALPDLRKYKHLHGVSVKDFGSTDDVFQGASVLVLGYPGILGQTYQTSPIARGGLIAWIDPDGNQTKPFLVDANIFGGNSGGPVFHQRSGFDRHGNMNIGGGYSFIGIVSEDAQEYSDVVITDTATYAKKFTPADPVTQKPQTVLAQVKNIGGIGVVEPVQLVRQLLEDAFGMPRGALSKP